MNDFNNIDEQQPSDDQADSPVKFKTCMEHFDQRSSTENHESVHTLDELIDFLDNQKRLKRNVLSSQEFEKCDPFSRLEDFFQLLNQNLFNGSLNVVYARWSKTFSR